MAPKVVSAFSALLLVSMIGGAHADVQEAAHNVRDASVDAVHQTGAAARRIGHATADSVRHATHATGRAIKTVGHDISGAAKNGYHATRRTLHKTTS
jgi:hypothetical protein